MSGLLARWKRGFLTESVMMRRNGHDSSSGRFSVLPEWYDIIGTLGVAAIVAAFLLLP